MDETTYMTFFKAISNSTRCKLVDLLRNRPMSVSQLCKKSGFEQSRVSHNLKCLEMCGFVNSQTKGKKRIYSLDKDIIAILNGIDKHFSKYHKRLIACGVISHK